jgi:sugar phosphate isomerase/epimerase
MGPSAEHFVELGKGTIDWPEILAQAKRQGIKYAFLDQDETSGPVIESMAESFGYLRKINE